MTTRTVECLYLLTLDLTFETFFNFKLKVQKDYIKLAKYIDTTLISLITLTVLFLSSLTWLLLRTLKEGRKALTDINKDRS